MASSKGRSAKPPRSEAATACLHALVCPMCAAEQKKDQDRRSFSVYLKEVAATVRGWPAWKRGALGSYAAKPKPADARKERR